MMEEMAVSKTVHVIETENEMLEERTISKHEDSTDMERVFREECIGKERNGRQGFVIPECEGVASHSIGASI